MTRKDIIALILVLAAFGVIGGRIWAAPSLEPAVGDPAIGFQLPTHDGKVMTLGRYEGHRGVLLVFFSVNCPACLDEVDEINHFVEKARERGVVVFGVNLGDPRPVVDRFVQEYGPKYRILLDGMGVVGSQYNILYIPHLVGIDAEGIVRYRHARLPRDGEALIAELTEPIERMKKEAAAAADAADDPADGEAVADAEAGAEADVVAE